MTRRTGRKDYPQWMKREVIRRYLEEGWSVSELMEHYDIRDRRRVSTWAKQYRQEGEAMFANKRKLSGRKPKKENTAAYIARLEMELDLLKKFHTELRRDSLVKRNIGSLKTTGEDTK